jgi:hypothetical protein
MPDYNRQFDTRRSRSLPSVSPSFPARGGRIANWSANALRHTPLMDHFFFAAGWVMLAMSEPIKAYQALDGFCFITFMTLVGYLVFGSPSGSSRAKAQGHTASFAYFVRSILRRDRSSNMALAMPSPPRSHSLGQAATMKSGGTNDCPSMARIVLALHILLFITIHMDYAYASTAQLYVFVSAFAGAVVKENMLFSHDRVYR